GSHALPAQTLETGESGNQREILDFTLLSTLRFRLWLLRTMSAFRFGSCPGRYISLVSMQYTGLPVRRVISSAWLTSLSMNKRAAGSLPNTSALNLWCM